jgi:hypothetical protein
MAGNTVVADRAADLRVTPVALATPLPVEEAGIMEGPKISSRERNGGGRR